jgi:hypothetical protein
VRTTLNLADDVLSAVKDRARREGRSIGEVISDLARQALTGPKPERFGEEAHGFLPLPPRGPVVSNAVIDGLLEDEAE